MESLTETLKGWFWFAVKAVLGITILMLVVFGPKDAAEFVGWVFGGVKDVGNSTKVFVEEVKKQG